MRRLFTIIIPFFISSIVSAQQISGPWKGDLQAGVTKISIVFHFNEGECLMDSPDQGAFGLPAEIGFISADSVRVSQAQSGAVFSGRLEDGKIVGRFSQGGLTMPLVLTPGELVRNRPQTPREPFPYESEEVTFSNGNATLSGTLVYPEGWDGRRRVPVAIMVTGSGAQNRDEELFGHKPFLVIADHLARNGIATLRYDDRGAGSSTGDVVNATTQDYKEDAAAGLDFLRSKGDFNKVGVIGHSEGGSIAFMLGAERKVDFLVSLAGPGVQGDSILLLQNQNALRKAGYPDAKLTKEFIRARIKAQKNAWMDYFIDYDPVQDIRAVRCPALILNGDKDTQVESAVNISSIYINLPRDRDGSFVSKHSRVKVYSGLNHLFQHCETGQADEYADIEETISPEVLKDIAAWISKL